MELKDIISGFINFICMTASVVFISQNIYNTVRALIISKKAGILTVIIEWLSIIVDAVIFAVTVLISVYFFSEEGIANYFGVYTLLYGVWQFTSGFVSIVYVTNEGLMTGRRDDPAPISAECSDGMINIYHRNRINESGSLGSVKATPKNMTAFKQFFVLSGLEQADTPPDNSNMLT